MTLSTMGLNLSDLYDRYPTGLHVQEHGCFYYLDYDNELGYYIELRDGTFEDEINYVDLDTMEENDRIQCESIAQLIASLG